MSMSRDTGRDRHPGTHILPHTQCMIRSHTHSGVSAFKDRGSKRVLTGVVMLSVKSEDLRFVVLHRFSF